MTTQAGTQRGHPSNTWPGEGGALGSGTPLCPHAASRRPRPHSSQFSAVWPPLDHPPPATTTCRPPPGPTPTAPPAPSLPPPLPRPRCTLGQYPSLASYELQNSQVWPRALDKSSWMNEEKLGGRVHNKGGTGLGRLSWVGARAQDPAGPRAISARLGAGLVSEWSGGDRCTGQHR